MGKYGADSEIDSKIDYVALFNSYLQKPLKPCGDNKLHSLCPFHDESNPSFWMRPDTGLWRCEAGCGAGNATAFLARAKNIATGEAWKELCEMAGVEKRPQPKYTLQEYAMQKRLPVEWLEKQGLANGYGNKYVDIPYYNEKRGLVATRMRFPPGVEPRFKWHKGGKSTLYGLWRLDEIRAARQVMLVEGESDTHTLWFYGIPALGLPGATTFSALHAKMLLDIPLIYIHQEPDGGGRNALRKITKELHDAGYKGTVKVWSCAAHEGCKDPSDLHLMEGADASRIMWTLAKAAEPINLELSMLPEPETLKDAPINLRVPIGYDLTEEGIFQLAKTGPRAGAMDIEPFCWTPLLISRILPGPAGDVKVEIAHKRSGVWRTTCVQRKVLASGQEIVALADLGMDITSENRAYVVKYLSALERTNVAIIPHVRRVTHYGWINAAQYLPGACDDEYVLDVEGANAGIGKSKGSFTAWRDAMVPHRKRSLFRFILACSFAAPLLQPLAQRSFWAYVFGDSKGGKTAALHCALSVWGEPEAMMGTFNATQVGLERMAAAFCDLPMGLNERQLAGSKQEYIEKIVYMLAEGKGRVRGNKNGGIQETSTWRTVILSNGEQEIAIGSTQTGVSTRVLELYGRPFEDDEEAASSMYTLTAQHHGHAGPAFVRQLLKTDISAVRGAFDALRADLGAHAGASRSHVASVSLAATADFLTAQWIWGATAEGAYYAAVGMGMEVLAALQSVEEADVGEKAYAWLTSWVLSNREQFTERHRSPRYGFFHAGSDEVLIFPSILEEAITKAGYAYQKTLRWLAENEKIKTAVEGGQVRFAPRRRMEGNLIRMIHLYMSVSGGTEAPNGANDIPPGFVQVQVDELPF